MSSSLNYTLNIQFEWDEEKSSRCFRERGFDFAYAASAFADPCQLVKVDARYNYGEDRHQLVGDIEGRVYVVIYTRRRNAIRIISARKANSREVKDYENQASAH